jgi:Xaa-Pro aminopeptidase
MRRISLLLPVIFALSVAAPAEQPVGDYAARRQALAARLEGGVLLLVAPSDRDAVQTFAGFAPEPDFYYLTGWSEPDAALLLAGEQAAAAGRPARPYTEILFLPARNPRLEEWQGRRSGPDDAGLRERTGFRKVAAMHTLPEELRVLLGGAARVTLHLKELQPQTAEALAWLRRANVLPHYTAFADPRPLLAELRVVKDERELALLQHAVDATVESHLAAMRHARPDMHEREIHGLMMYEFMRRDCERPGYGPIVASGPNSTILHYKDSSRVMRAGEVLKIDVGAQCAGYVADITRTLPVSSKFTARQRELYEVVLGAQRAAEQAFQAGQSTLARSGPGSLHLVAMEHINNSAVRGPQGERLGRYFIHGLGHFIGLQVHDVGDNAQPLRPGMVFTIEPGIYIPEENIGIRIEDMYYVAADGSLVKMSRRLPSAPHEVERAMAERK